MKSRKLTMKKKKEIEEAYDKTVKKNKVANMVGNFSKKLQMNLTER